MPTSLLLFDPSSPVPRAALVSLSPARSLEELVAVARGVRGRRAREFDAAGVHGGLPGLRGVVRRAGACLAAGDAGDGGGVPRGARGGRKAAAHDRARTLRDRARASDAGIAWLRGAPAIGKVMSGIRRRHGAAGHAQKAPLGDEDLVALVGTLGEGRVGLRDRALLTLGWMGAFRRSELVALRVEDVTRTRDGLVVRVRRSKSDQEGRGAEKGIPYASRPALCPVRALSDWLEAGGIASGPLFRAVDRFGRVRDAALSDRSVARIVQRAAAAAGFESNDRRRSLPPGGFCDDGGTEREGA